SALRIGVAAFAGSFWPCPGVTLRPRLGAPRSFPEMVVPPLGLEKSPKNTSNKAMLTPTSRKRDLLLSRPRSRRLATGFWLWRTLSKSARRLLNPPGPVSSTSVTLPTDGESVSNLTVWFFSVPVVCDSMSILLEQRIDSEADRRKCRAIHSARIRHLQKEFLV